MAVGDDNEVGTVITGKFELENACVVVKMRCLILRRI